MKFFISHIFSGRTHHGASLQRGIVPALLLLLLAGCRGNDYVILPEDETVDRPAADTVAVEGFYLLNEGNMGMNASTLDYFDYATGTYHLNIYASANPTVPKELGDVGNDIAIYGTRMYAVINCSNKVEVMEAATARRIGQIDIPNCRHIVFSGPYAYVTSYAGPVQIDPDYKQLGYVARIDTATMQVTARCTVGFQPDGMAIHDGKIYVANSGGYMVPNYENTLTVIDEATFQAEGTIVIAPNLQYVLADRHGAMWVTARGDYYGQPAAVYRYDLARKQVTDTLTMAAGGVWQHGDSLYVVGTTFNYDAYDQTNTYAIIDMGLRRVVNECFVADAQLAASMDKPYGVAVNPVTGDIILTDAGNYVNPGYVYCLSADGTERWRRRAGDIPAHIVFR